MIEIGTHNSITGYRGKGLLSKLITPFAKCQTKTLTEQYSAGVTYFDIRVKYHKGKFVLCHGLWIASISIETAFDILNGLSYTKPIYVDVTLETNSHKQEFIELTNKLYKKYTNIAFSRISYKKPKWETIKTYNITSCLNRFLSLDGGTLHFLIPIPWFWNKVYKYDNEKGYINIRDFV